jgi:hypothetical protein
MTQVSAIVGFVFPHTIRLVSLRSAYRDTLSSPKTKSCKMGLLSAGIINLRVVFRRTEVVDVAD